MSLEYVVVDNERNVNVPESLQKLGVQNDHDVELRRFTCPRYSSAGDDMSQMGVYINYMCADGSTGQHRCSNVEVDSTDENLMHFDWMIKRNVTLINGPVTFLVCIRKVDADGNETDHWNSEICTDCYISEGMECAEEIVDLNPDIIEHLLLRMNIVEAKTTDMAMQGYVQSYLDRNPDVIVDKVADVVDDSQVQGYVDAYMNNYVDVCTTTDRTLANSHAGAYELVSMGGNSEQVKTNGYQLFKHNAEEFTNLSAGGASITNNGDGTFSVTGSGTLTDAVSMYHYYTHAESVKLFKAGKLYLKCEGTVTTPKVYIHPQVNNSSLAGLTPGGTTEFELTEAMVTDESFRMVAGIYGNAGDKIVPGTFSVMLYQDGVGDLEPFTGGRPAPNVDYQQTVNSVSQELTIMTCNKNLVHFEAVNKTEYGVKFDVDSDAGTITANGTATGNIFYRVGTFYAPKTGDYKLSGCIDGEIKTHLLYIQKPGGAGYVHVTSGEKTFTAGDTDERTVLIAIYEGQTVSNLVFKPMISVEGGDFVPRKTSSTTVNLKAPIRGKNSIVDILEKIYREKTE